MSDAPRNTDWHPADIMAALRKTPERWSLRRLSLAGGYSANAVGEALRKPWPAVEKLVADALGREPQDIWPSRYTRSGEPKRGRIPLKSRVQPCSGRRAPTTKRSSRA